MGKPTNLKELLRDGHITLGEVRKIAKDIFDGKTTAAGPEGYVVTAVKFDTLPDHVRGFIVKAILEFKVENVFDSHKVEYEDDSEPEAPDAEETYGLTEED